MKHITFFLLVIVNVSLNAQTSFDISSEVQISNTLSTQERVDTLVKYVRKQLYKNNYEVALAEGEKARVIARQINDFKSVYKLSSLMGNSLLKVKDTVAAKSIFLNILNEAKKKNDTSVLIGASIDMGNIYALQNDDEKTISTFKAVIPLAELKHDTIRLYILNYNIAEIYLDQENGEASLPYVNRTQIYA